MQFIPSAAIPQPQAQMQATPGPQIQTQVQQVQPQVQSQFLNPQLLYAAQQVPLQPGMMGGGMVQQVGGPAAVTRDATMAGAAQAQVAAPQLQQAPQQQMPQQMMAQPQQLQAQQYQVPSHMQQQQQLYYGSVDLGRPLV